MARDTKPEQGEQAAGAAGAAATATAADGRAATDGPGGNAKEAEPPTAASGESYAEPPERARFNLGKAIPFLILLLAVGILLRITTSWNFWVGAAAVQKTNDAYVRA